MTKVAVLRFPGSNCDCDMLEAANQAVDAEFVWHKEFSADGWDAVLLPGGFTYGDHLRAGIIAAYSPAMEAVKALAAEGKPVLGVCNGFQILVEAGLLPGALLRNAGTKFISDWVYVTVRNRDTPFTSSVSKKALKLPIAHGEGQYFIEPAGLAKLKLRRQIVFSYVEPTGEESEEANPNGSLENIAGICNEAGNVVGLMPHPERAILKLLGSEDGKEIFTSLANTLREQSG